MLQVLFGGLMFIQNKDLRQVTKQVNFQKRCRRRNRKIKDSFSDRYYIEANKKLKAELFISIQRIRKQRAVHDLSDTLGKSLPNGNSELSPNIHGLINTVVGTSIIHI